MKTILFFTLFWHSVIASGNTWDKFRTAVAESDKQKAASLFKYPVVRSSLAVIQNKEDMLGYYDLLIDHSIRTLFREYPNNMNLDSIYENHFGVGVLSGNVWFNEHNIFAFAFQTEAEKEYLSILEEEDQDLLHPDLKGFGVPELLCKTPNHTLRVDRLRKPQEGFHSKYRLAIWNGQKAMSEKPDKIIHNGKFSCEGSIGTTVYSFTDRFLKYELNDQVQEDGYAGFQLAITSRSSEEIKAVSAFGDRFQKYKLNDHLQNGALDGLNLIMPSKSSEEVNNEDESDSDVYINEVLTSIYQAKCQYIGFLEIYPD